jgi:hypothetical protein
LTTQPNYRGFAVRFDRNPLQSVIPIIAVSMPSNASMSPAVDIAGCTPQDYAQILDDLAQFWDGRDVRHLHHPFLIRVRQLGFRHPRRLSGRGLFVRLSLADRAGRLRARGGCPRLGAAAAARATPLWTFHYGHFIEFARLHGCKSIKAITTPANAGSIAFHKSLGMELLGEPNADGVPVVLDYAGRGIPVGGLLDGEQIAMFVCGRGRPRMVVDH